MADTVEYRKPADFADLLWEALRSDANPDQRDEAARKVCNYVADVLNRLDELEEQVSNLPSEHEVRDWISGNVR